MQLLAWILVCAVLAYATRRRPLVGIVTVVSLWILVPSVAGGLVTGRSIGSLAFHPATWLIFALVAGQLLANGRALLAVAARHVFLLLSLALVVGVALLTTRYSTAGGGLVLLADQVIGPVCLFFLVLAATRGRSDALPVLRNTLLTLSAVTAAVTVAQWLAGRVLIYEAAHSTRRWFTREGFDRWLGTTDHPLTLALVLCVCMPLVVGLRRASVQFPLLALSAVAVVISQSRVALFVLAGVTLYVVLRSRARPATKAVLTVALAVGAIALSASTLTQGIASRFADDTGSAQARGSAFRFFAERWTEFAVVGGGFTSSFRLTDTSGLATSLESSALMYAIDIGVVFALLYFGAQAVIVVRGLVSPSIPGLRLASVVVLVLPHTYSALASGSAVGPLLWVVLAMVVAAADASPGASAAEDVEPRLAVHGLR